MVNYKDYLLVQYDSESKKTVETQVIPSKLHFEYIDGLIDQNGIAELVNSKIALNCIADVVLIEVFQLQVSATSFDILLVLKDNDIISAIRECFKLNMFSEEPRVFQVGTYLHSPRGVKPTVLYS